MGIAETIAAGFGALTAGLGFLLWREKRKLSPTREEQAIDADQEYAKRLEEISKLREAGDHAGADALLRRLYDDFPSKRGIGGPGERRAFGLTEGDSDPATDGSGRKIIAVNFSERDETAE